MRALKTADYAEALERLPLVSAEVNAEFAEARRKSGVKPITSSRPRQSSRNALRQENNSEGEISWRRAVAETCR